MALRIWKGEALGNDYLVVDAAELPWPLTPAAIRAICDRHRGLGSDGLLVARPGGGNGGGYGGGSAGGNAGEGAAIGLRIYNPDGSEAEKSGNGLRIFGAWLHGRGEVGGEAFRVALARDEVTMLVEEAGDPDLQIVVQMGRASFVEVLGAELELADGEVAAVHTVSLANPHCVVFVEELERGDFLRRAPQLAVHRAFSAGTNVQFARALGPATLEAWIWERGAGETLASGSSACAVAAAATRLGLVTSPELEVRMPGGTVEVGVDAGYAIRLRGPARIVYVAEVAAGVAAEWGRADGGRAGGGG
jgi:diaminopimelate epimerase